MMYLTQISTHIFFSSPLVLNKNKNFKTTKENSSDYKKITYLRYVQKETELKEKS